MNQCTPCDFVHSGPINQTCLIAWADAIEQYVLANNLSTQIATLDDSTDSDLTNAQPHAPTVVPPSGHFVNPTGTSTNSDVNNSQLYDMNLFLYNTYTSIQLYPL